MVIVSRDSYTPLLDISGFLGILAFSLAVFTITAPKFQIRQATALIPFRPIYFGVLVVSAALTLSIEACIIFGIRTPNFLNANTINYSITAAIATLILYWMNICFIRPPRFSRFTAKRFFEETFYHISNGSKEEMLALAREIIRESPRLISHTPAIERHHFAEKRPPKLSKIQVHAHNINALLADTRFCAIVAKEIPSFPAHIIEVAIELKRYDAPIQLMVRRAVIAMLNNPESALFVENEWLSQGFIGYEKPITRSIFGNWHLLEGFESGMDAPLDLGYPYARGWDRNTWIVYFGMAREYIQGLTSNQRTDWSARGIHYILQTTEQAYNQIGSVERYADISNSHDPIWIAREANNFLKDLIKSFDNTKGRLGFNRKEKFRCGHDLSSKLAALYFEVIFRSAQVNTKDFIMWDVQRNTAWDFLQDHEVKDTDIMKMIRRKLRRMIWNEISQMERFPNYKGAAYVRFCLNVFGFHKERTYYKNAFELDTWPLAKVVAKWVKTNYQTIAISHGPVAEAMLPANIEYDRSTQKLVRTFDNTFTGSLKFETFTLAPPRDEPRRQA